MNTLRYSVVDQTLVVATERGKVRWRWRAQKPLNIVGVTYQILVAQEHLAGEGYAPPYRITGLDAATGHRRWQVVEKNIDGTVTELYERLILLYEPNGLYATGDHVMVDVRSGKKILSVGGDLKDKKPNELLWVNTPGYPPYQTSNLDIARINPQTLKTQSLSLPLPNIIDVFWEERPTRKYRVRDNQIEIIYAGSRKSKEGKTRETIYYLVRYLWNMGNRQKPQIMMVDKPDWPR